MHDVPRAFSSEYFSENTLVQGLTTCFQSLLLHKTHNLFSLVLYWKRCLGFWVTTKHLITLLPTSQLIGCRSVTIHHNHFNSASCWPDHLDICCTPFAFFSPLILRILIVYIFDSFNFPYDTQPLWVKGGVGAFAMLFSLFFPQELWNIHLGLI